MATETWKEVCRRKREEQAASIPTTWLLPSLPPASTLNVLGIPRTCGLLSEKELEITELDDIAQLLESIETGKWSSVQVVTAFAKRACIAHQLTNCLTEIFIDKALERARWLDDYLKTEGKPIGPLHGLPISLKDQFCIKGLDTVMGYAAWVGKTAEEDCTLVSLLLELGAIPYVRTNVPQTLMWGETYNNVYLRTVNPYNRLLTPGGSSGGEGALLALHGSPLGVGTDIGGSVRIPATWCGLYSLRPSYNRLPYQGACNSFEGFEAVPSVLGPMAHSLPALKTFTKAIVNAKPWDWDPEAVRKLWSEREEKLDEHGQGKGLCFGILWDDGLVRVHPPVGRALEMTKAAVEAAGHTVIEWKHYKPLEIRAVLNALFLSDGGTDFVAHTSLPPHELLLTTVFPRPDSPFSHPSLALPPPAENTLLLPHPSIPVHELYSLHVEKRQLAKGFLDAWISSRTRTGTGRPVDALLAPVMATPAPPHGRNAYDFYCEYWNVVDCPCVVLPVTKVNPEVDRKEPAWEWRCQEERVVHELYEPELFRDMPVGIQVIGRKQEEEAVLSIAQLVDDALKSHAVAKQDELES
ncbi:general amidase [Dacryopinax primogenitus]|uniref:amidase n=1 Tax=Dacryopinax primogenitus (strain DJM 731) TaxID=1858805 RepID=M5G8U8_DACPD|nr:general amidase [Dacryopinax primogenitus]EJU04610.1 general amidase [Dacryopinax primogenitus]